MCVGAFVLLGNFGGGWLNHFQSGVASIAENFGVFRQEILNQESADVGIAEIQGDNVVVAVAGKLMNYFIIGAYIHSGDWIVLLCRMAGADVYPSDTGYYCSNQNQYQKSRNNNFFVTFISMSKLAE